MDQFRTFRFNEKLELEYPCYWKYKIIGTDAEKMRKAVRELIDQKEPDISVSHFSRNGTYCCLNFETMVPDEEYRTYLFYALKKHPAIKMVL